MSDIIVSISHGWQTGHEAFCKCRHCHCGTMFAIRLKEYGLSEKVSADGSVAALKGNINIAFDVVRAITIRDTESKSPPEFVPDVIAAIFKEGTSSYSARCFNAAGAMFRLTLDLTTKSLLPGDADSVPQPNSRQRSNLVDRLDWLFEQAILPSGLRELATCIRQNGNDAAHDGALTEADAGDLLDFSAALLERVFTEPRRLEEAMSRREERRKPAAG